MLCENFKPWKVQFREFSKLLSLFQIKIYYTTWDFILLSFNDILKLLFNLFYFCISVGHKVDSWFFEIFNSESIDKVRYVCNSWRNKKYRFFKPFSGRKNLNKLVNPFWKMSRNAPGLHLYYINIKYKFLLKIS